VGSDEAGTAGDKVMGHSAFELSKNVAVDQTGGNPAFGRPGISFNALP
jgi:hypothetical protein